jgi:8-oxo-dGTP diphosphatase
MTTETYRSPSIAVDSVVFDPLDRLLLIRRKYPPFEGLYALPGGYLEYGETVEKAGARELLEETGLQAIFQRLIGIYSAPDRDPRGHVISVALLTQVSHCQIRAGDDAASAEFVDWNNQVLAFDHNDIVRDALLLRRSR